MKKANDGYKATAADKSWKSGTGNVVESKFNKGKSWGSAMKPKKPSMSY